MDAISGYMAPEYDKYGEISAQSDIYSLGLIILEIVTRNKNTSSIDQKQARAYIDEVRKIIWHINLLEDLSLKTSVTNKLY